MSDWKTGLNRFLEGHGLQQDRDSQQLDAAAEAAKQFMEAKVVPAVEEVRAVLEMHGRRVEVTIGPLEVRAVVWRDDVQELDYRVTCRVGKGWAHPYPTTVFESEGRLVAAEGTFRYGNQRFNVNDISQSEISSHMSEQFRSHLAKASSRPR